MFRLTRAQVSLKAILAMSTLLSVSEVGASTLLHNINGYTMYNGERQRFAAIEYDQGKIVATYASAETAIQSPAEHRIDGKGATVLPGLIDAHGHVANLGAALSQVDLTGTSSEQAAAQRVAQHLATTSIKPQQWIEGRGWNQVLWSDKQFPDRASLDAITSRHPVALSRVDGHALWVNSKALELAGINATTRDPEGGQILRDSDGRATGVLIDNAMDLVFDIIGEPSIADLEGVLHRGLLAAAATGITTVHDAGIGAQQWQAYQGLQQRSELPIRVYPMLSVLDPGNDVHLERGPLRSSDGYLHLASVKISADGALGSRGAALHRDYSDQPGHMGLLLLSDKDLRHHIQRSAMAGFQVNVHAIGDLANTRVLDEFARLNKDPAIAALRHRIEHAQIVQPSDIPRFAQLGVIASVQPTHATSDKNMAGDRLGDARLAGAYAWKTLLGTDAQLAGGSDFPVEPPNPLYGLHAAVTRRDRDGNPLGGWRVAEALTRDQALSLFTEWAAYAGHEEQYLGRLLPGYAADFVLLSEDYFSQDAQTIWQNNVLATVVAGRWVYQSPDAPSLD